MDELIARTVAAVRPADVAAAEEASVELDAKAKPPGSLGRLESLAVRLAGVRGPATPRRATPAVVVCAADHGVAEEDVSAYPQQVTGLMLATFASGGAAVGVLARQAGARLVVADLGVVEAPAGIGEAGVLDRRVRAGTGNSAAGPAMTRAEAEQAVRHGIELVHDLVADGVDLVALGEMGIGNTTTASALTALLLDRRAVEVCGRGTGLDDAGVARKARTVERIRARHGHLTDPWDVLAAVGGLEVAALAGVVLGCAAARVPVVLDGFITTAAALVAARVAPDCVDAMVAGHRSAEPGHTVQLDALGLVPVLELDLRLGEGSGAVLAVGVLQSALAVLAEMATFASLGLGD